MLKALCLVTFMVCYVASERISNQGSPTWERRTTEDPYGYNRDRSPSFDRDQEERVRGSGSATDRPSGRFTYSWERSEAPSPTRSSYLDRFTTERPAGGSPYDRSRESSADREYTASRRPSYVTDKWGDVVGGSPTSRPGYVTMYPTDSWRESGSGRTSAWGSATTRSRWALDTTRSWGSAGSAGRYDRNDAYVRIQFELTKLVNDKGVNIDGAKCDTFGACDTVCYAYIDTERPKAEWPGSREQKWFTKIYQTEDNNSPTFTKANVTREVCGDPYREATGRVYCEDEDSMSKADLINKWDCPMTSDPELSETMATWQTGTCKSKTQSDKMTLTFRYKVYSIPSHRCDPKVGGLPAGATTAAPTSTRRRS